MCREPNKFAAGNASSSAAPCEGWSVEIHPVRSTERDMPTLRPGARARFGRGSPADKHGFSVPTLLDKRLRSDLISVPRTIRSRRCNGGWGTSESSCAAAGRTTGGMTAARRPPSGSSTCSPGLSSSRRLLSWSSMTSRPVRKRPALKGNGLFPALDSVALLPPRIIGIAHDFACALVEQKRLNGAQEWSLSRRLKRVFSPAEARRFAGLREARVGTGRPFPLG